MASACGRACKNFFTSVEDWGKEKLPNYIQHLQFYEVPRTVKIHAAPLQIPRVMTYVAATVAVFAWMIQTLHVYEFNEISISNSFMQLAPPVDSSCYDFDFDCDDKPETVPREYCMPNTLDNFASGLKTNLFGNHTTYSKVRWPLGPPDVKASCQRFDANDILEEEGEPLIMTARTLLSQIRCSAVEQEECVWQNQNLAVEFVRDVETFWLAIRHDVVAEGVQASNPASAGYVTVDGHQFRLECTHAACKAAGIHQNSGDAPSCGDIGLEDGKCFSSKYADYLSLRLVLHAAGLSLNSTLPMPGDLPSAARLPRRYHGASVGIDVKYSNVAPGAWRQWPPGLKPSYTYTFRKMSDYAREIDVQHVDTQQRKLIRKSGIKIFISFSGKLGRWNPIFFLKQLAILNIIWGLTLWAVDKLLLCIYTQLPYFKHLPAVRKYYAQDETPHHMDIKSIHTFEDLKKHRDSMKAKFLEQIHSDGEEDSGV